MISAPRSNPDLSYNLISNECVWCVFRPWLCLPALMYRRRWCLVFPLVAIITISLIILSHSVITSSSRSLLRVAPNGSGGVNGGTRQTIVGTTVAQSRVKGLRAVHKPLNTIPVAATKVSQSGQKTAHIAFSDRSNTKWFLLLCAHRTTPSICCC